MPSGFTVTTDSLFGKERGQTTMTQIEHTPGPWLVGRGDTKGEFSVWTRQPHTGTLATVHDEDINGQFPAEANARLIAAAPALHAALEKLASDEDAREAIITSVWGGLTLMGQIDAALRSATT